MTKTISFLVITLAVATVAGSGCVPIWAYYDAVEKNKNYLEIIDGHQKEHEQLNRDALEAVSKAAMLEIDNLTLDKKRELAEKLAKQMHKELEDRLTTAVKTVDLGQEVGGGEVKVTSDGKISIAGDVLFPSGSADLTAKAKAILKKLAPMLKTQFKDAFIRIEGHTDDQPIKKPGTLKKFPTNWHLSMARAVSVLMELKSLGIPEKSIYAAGYGEFKPRVPNKPGKKGHPENRRVEIAIVEAK